MANSATVTITTPVVACTSFREGVVTLRISLRTSLRNPTDWSHQLRTTFPPLSSLPLAAKDLLVATFAIASLLPFPLAHFFFQVPRFWPLRLALCSRYSGTRSVL